MNNVVASSAIFAMVSMSISAFADESDKVWKSWPVGAPKCTDHVVNDYLNASFLSKGEALYYLSICSHTTAGDIEDFVYALSQTGSPKESTIHSIANFANTISTKPDVWEYCLKSAGIKTRDENGAWNSISSVMMEFVQRMDKANPQCLELLK